MTESLKTPLDAWRLLENVVQLTGQKERQALETCLISTLREMIGAQEVVLYESHDDQGERVFKSLVRAGVEAVEAKGKSKRPVPLSQDWLAECVAQRKEVMRSSVQGVRVALPVFGPDGVIGVLALRCTELSERDRELLMGFVRIYQNYLYLLLDNEHDTLTGLYNRRNLELRLSEAMSGEPPPQRRSYDRERSYCLGVLDIDHFKSINDRFGHLYGDEVLLLFSRIMRKNFREVDLLFRYGGEEFIVLLKNVDEERAKCVLERLRQAVQAYPFPRLGGVTVSIGFVLVSHQGLPSDVISQADRALYYAKEHGRNQVCGFEALVREGKLADQEREEGSIDIF
ncbi:MAG: GGDEF domain-containing protein [Gammaproteobacteria bacterium]